MDVAWKERAICIDADVGIIGARRRLHCWRAQEVVAEVLLLLLLVVLLRCENEAVDVGRMALAVHDACGGIRDAALDTVVAIAILSP